MDAAYPASFTEMEQWGKPRGLKPHEIRVRFVELVILACISGNRSLRNSLVFKGGNALRFVYLSPRSTKDLDFTLSGQLIPDDDTELRVLFDRALKQSERRFDVKCKCQAIRRNPADPQKTRPTYRIKIAYQFRNDRYFHNFDEARSIPTTIPVEISINDLVCEAIDHRLSNISDQPLKVCSREDIVAEKLRSLLQQPIRKRQRGQDVYDIARMMQKHKAELDQQKIADYLQQKASVRNIEAKRSSFDARIRGMARRDYDSTISKQTGEHFIPFESAWSEVLALVQSLRIPD